MSTKKRASVSLRRVANRGRRGILAHLMHHLTEALFTPVCINRLRLPNRIVMAPMTRAASPDGVPGPDVAAYYRRRAEGGVGLIVTEGTWIPHPAAGFTPPVPRFHGEDALAGWRRVREDVHAAGGRACEDTGL